MARTTKAQLEAAQRLRDAFDAGATWWTSHQENDLATVHRFASAVYPNKEEAFEFVAGYSAARRRHDDFLREKAS